MRHKRITIDPFVNAHLNPNSYNYRIGKTILEIASDDIDAKQPEQTHVRCIPECGFVLWPGKLYLAHTLEVIGSDHYVTSLIGRSTIGRLGLWLQVCADLGHAGSKHRWTLELKVVEPLRIYAGMVIGQVMFWQIRGQERTLYQGKYVRDMLARPSALFEEFAL